MSLSIYMPLLAHPSRTPPSCIARTVDLASRIGGHLTGIVHDPQLVRPVTFHPFGTAGEADRARRQSGVDAAARAVAADLDEASRKAGIDHLCEIVPVPEGGVAEAAVPRSRLYDLAALAAADDEAGLFAEIASALMFQSGRPVLLVPDGGDTLRLGRVVVAWDFGRAASRALADAAPLLAHAASVELLVVTSDKEMPDRDGAGTLLANLARRGIEAGLREVDRGGRTVGEAIDAAAEGADLLVMGAFGHSRMRDFVLGGATLHVLKTTRLPTLLSH